MGDKICIYVAYKGRFHKTSCGHMPTISVIPARSKEFCPYCKELIVWETQANIDRIMTAPSKL